MISIPIKLLLQFIQATPTVPDPIQLSKTFSPGLVYVLIKYCINSNGFSVGCIVLEGCTFWIDIIDVGYLFVFPFL